MRNDVQDNLSRVISFSTLVVQPQNTLYLHFLPSVDMTSGCAFSNLPGVCTISSVGNVFLIV